MRKLQKFLNTIFPFVIHLHNIIHVHIYNILKNERKSEQAHIPHAPTLPENGVNNEWQFQALVTGNQTENQFQLSCTK